MKTREQQIQLLQELKLAGEQYAKENNFIGFDEICVIRGFVAGAEWQEEHQQPRMTEEEMEQEAEEYANRVDMPRDDYNDWRNRKDAYLAALRKRAVQPVAVEERPQICYKSDKPCPYNCSGLCRDSY